MPVAGALITRARLTHFHPLPVRIPGQAAPPARLPVALVSLASVPLPVRSICQRHVTAWAALNCVSKDFFSFLFCPLLQLRLLLLLCSSSCRRVSPMFACVVRSAACCLFLHHSLPVAAAAINDVTHFTTNSENEGNPFGFFDFRLFLVTSLKGGRCLLPLLLLYNAKC